MERRNFIQMMAAAGVAPAMPMPTLASTAPATVAPTSVQYAWAAHYARIHNTASPARLMAALKVSPDVANGLMAKMLETGVIQAPTAGGISAAARPFPKTHHLRTGLQDQMHAAIRKLNQAARSGIRNRIAHDPTAPPPRPRQSKRITPPHLTGHLSSLR